VQHAILRGDDVTGASTFRIEQGLDTGPVYGSVTETIRPDDTAGTLLGRLAVGGAQLLVATMDGIEDGSLRARAQAADGVSIAGKITVDDARVDWTQPARHIDRLVRACTPAPGAWTTVRDERVKIGPVRATGDRQSAPGAIAISKAAVTVGTATEDVELTVVQPAGRKPMSAADWARGARLESGERFA
jgi:methionyl-tRNA formyltransferase